MCLGHSDIDFVATGESLTISTGTDQLVRFTPVDPTTGDFAEETRTFSGLPDDGMVRATLTGFTAGIDGNSIILKNGITLQGNLADYDFTSTSIEVFGRSYNGDEITVLYGGTLTTVTGCLLYTSPSPRDRQKSRMPSSA